MNRNALLIFSLILSVGLIQGCSAPQPQKKADPLSAVAKDLRSIAYAIKKENEQLSLLEQEKLKVEGAIPSTQRDIQLSEQLSKPITIKWTGEVEPLLKIISQDIGYAEFNDIHIDGQKPIVSKIIKINAHKETAYSVLKDIGWQLGAKTKVLVDDQQKTIRLIYTSDY